MNVGANMVGNHVRWVIVLNAVGLIDVTTLDGSMLNMAFIGLMPRSAPKIASVGGSLENTEASCGAPALVTAEDNAPGSFDERLKISIVKKMPILAVVPTFLNVVSMPDAEPLLSGGTDDMTADVFGAVNMPIPAPKINNNIPISIYMKLYGRNERRINANADIKRPRVAIPFDPCLSDNFPESGPNMPMATVIGSMNIPAQKGALAYE